MKGELFVVQIPKDVYLAGLEECKNHLYGRIILAKGDKPLTHLDFCKKLYCLEFVRPIKGYSPWNFFL